MDTFSQRSTHVIECVVPSNKVVSAREAHVERPKVETREVQDEGRKERRALGKRLEARRPPCHEAHACWSIFIYPQPRA